MAHPSLCLLAWWSVYVSVEILKCLEQKQNKTKLSQALQTGSTGHYSKVYQSVYNSVWILAVSPLPEGYQRWRLSIFSSVLWSTHPALGMWIVFLIPQDPWELLKALPDSPCPPISSFLASFCLVFSFCLLFIPVISLAQAAASSTCAFECFWQKHPGSFPPTLEPLQVGQNKGKALCQAGQNPQPQFLKNKVLIAPSVLMTTIVCSLRGSWQVI